MDTVAKREWLVLVGLVLILLISLIPALQYARAERRDGITRAEVLALKHAMEEKNNELGYYPTDFVAGAYQFAVLEKVGGEARAWYLRGQLENEQAETAAFDEEHNIYYRVIREDEATYYDICGGAFTCGVLRDER